MNKKTRKKQVALLTILAMVICTMFCTNTAKAETSTETKKTISCTVNGVKRTLTWSNDGSIYFKNGDSESIRLIPDSSLFLSIKFDTYGTCWTYTNAVKNFKLPVYKVNIATNIAGAAGYSVSHLDVISSYGVKYRVFDYNDSYDADHSMFVYLPAGSYEVVTYDYDSSDNDITAYGKVEESTEGTFKEYRLLNSLGDYKVSGNFTVNGNSTVVLNAEKKAEQEG